MTGLPSPRRRITERLGFQVAALLALVLLPLTAISMARSAALEQEVRARSEAALTGETLRAAALPIQFIQRARSAAGALASAVPPLIADVAGCTAVMRRVADAEARYAAVAFVGRDGLARCSSTGRTTDYSASPLFRTAIATGAPTFFVSPRGMADSGSVLGLTHPVRGAAGEDLGLVAVIVPHNALMPAGPAHRAPLELVTFDNRGKMLTTTVPGAPEATAAILPRDRPLRSLATEETLAFTAPSAGGTLRVFSVVPLVGGDLYALGSWPVDSGITLPVATALVPLAFPALMWLASLIIAWLAVERLVNRHIRSLRRAMITFTRGDRQIGAVDLRGAPLEIREVGEAHAAMTETIIRDAAELENIVHQKEVLLRELHHRVKNNLQLIASIMNMQIRRAHAPEARALLRSIQDRVMSLATIHSELFHTSELADVRARELLDSVVRQITAMSTRPGQHVAVESDFADLRMTPDQAVPLGLLVAEALTTAIRASECTAPDAAPTRIRLELRRDGPHGAIFTLSHRLGDPARAPAGGDDLGPQLLLAFASQLGGRIAVDETDGIRRFTLNFAIRPVSHGEDPAGPGAAHGGS